MKIDNEMLLLGSLAGMVYYVTSTRDSEESSQGSTFSGGAYGVPDSALAQIQNTSLPVETKKEVKQIVDKVSGSSDTRLDSIEVFNYSTGSSSKSIKYVDVTTKKGVSTQTTQSLALEPNTVTFIKSPSGDISGAYDSSRLQTLTKKSAQTVYENKSNPIVGISDNFFTSLKSKFGGY